MSLRREHDRIPRQSGSSASDAMTHRIRGYAVYQVFGSAIADHQEERFQPQ